MKPYILYSKVSSVTGKALCAALGYDGGTKAPPKGTTTLLRWGSTYAPDLDNAILDIAGRVFNLAEIVELSVNRRNMMQRLVASIGSPHCLRIARHVGEANTNYSWIARQFFGRWGQDVQDLTAPGRHVLGEGIFLVERWPGDFEVRVHIVNNASISFQVKLRKDENGEPIYARTPEATGAAGQLTIRNEDNGWHLYPLSNEAASLLGISKDTIREVAKSTMKNFGLDFGCVDFLVRVPGSPLSGSQPQAIKVLEVNSAPGLRDSTLDAYVRALSNLVNHERTPEADAPISPPQQEIPTANANQVTAVPMPGVGNWEQFNLELERAVAQIQSRRQAAEQQVRLNRSPFRYRTVGDGMFQSSTDNDTSGTSNR